MDMAKGSKLEVGKCEYEVQYRCCRSNDGDPDGVGVNLKFTVNDHKELKDLNLYVMGTHVSILTHVKCCPRCAKPIPHPEALITKLELENSE